MSALLTSFAGQSLETLECIVVLGAHWYRTELRRHHAGEQRLPVPANGLEVEILLERVDPPDGLTGAELDVMTLIACGYSNIDAAVRLHVAPRTIATHVEHILDKLDLDNRTSMAVTAVQRGLLRVPLPGGVGGGRRKPPGELERALRMTLPDAASAPPVPRRRWPRGSVLLGSVFPLDNAEGVDMQRGATLAIDLINQAGGVGGRPVEHLVINADTASHASLAEGVATLLSQNVDAITFAYSEDRHAVPQLLDVVAGTDVPFVHSMTSDAAARLVSSSPGTHGNVYGLSPRSGFYGVEFLRFIHTTLDQAATSRCAIVLTDDYEIPDGFADWHRLALTLGYDLELVVCADAQSWIDAARDISSRAPSAVLLASFLPASVRTFLDEFLAHPSPTLIYGMWAPSTRDFAADLARFDGIVWATATGRYLDALGERFSSAFQSRFGAAPSTASASIQFDAVNLLHRGWTSGPSPRALTRVNEAMRTLVHRGINGSYHFGDRTQSPLSFPAQTLDLSLGQAHLIYQVQGGRNRIIAPSPFADSVFCQPPWMRPGAGQRAN